MNNRPERFRISSSDAVINPKNPFMILRFQSPKPTLDPKRFHLALDISYKGNDYPNFGLLFGFEIFPAWKQKQENPITLIKREQKFEYRPPAQSKFNKPKADTKERADHGEDSSNGLSFCGFCVLKTFLKEMKKNRWVRNFDIQESKMDSEDWYFPRLAFEKVYKEMNIEDILDNQIKRSYDIRIHEDMITRIMVKTTIWCL
ncbi:hypothetical protein L2E82_40576 [Cichorium intybus]|uniref:Uncharacterized protein n=1 Tax=Cichorium intybus TaxID=13427 RepID=A0ACB9AKP8_CICIN|nr:hypothetical protein L2E82_40576 [Cichorium intybus]